MKKFISVMLAVLVIGSALPFAVYAADENSADPAEKSVVSEISETTAPTETTESTEATEFTESTEATDSTEPETTEPTESVTDPVTEPSTAPDTEPTTAPDTEPVTEPSKLANVKNLTLKATENKAVIKWTKSATATGYVLQRAIEYDNGKMSAFKNYKTLQATSFTDTGLTPGKLYKYKVFACRVNGSTATYSSGVVGSVITNPAAPKTVKVDGKDTNMLVIKWSKVSGATKYIIYRSVEKADGKFTKYTIYKTVKAKKTGLKDTKLVPGKVYRYRVRPVRVKGKLTATGKTNGIRTITMLSAPKKFVVKSAKSTSITLAWSKVTRADKYELYRKTEGSDYKKLTTTTDRVYTDTGVMSGGTEYKYLVRGIRVINDKKHVGKDITIIAATAVGSVGGITARSYLSRAVLTWKDVSGADGYDVFVYKANGKWKYKDTVYHGAYLSGKLDTGRTYVYSVKAFTKSGGNKVYSNSKTVNVTPTNTAFGSAAPTGTWVEICTETQMMFMYVNNKMYVKTPVVTGMYNSQDTTPGYHTVISRGSPTRLAGSAGGHSWDVAVQYWMGFTGDGQGIHDSSWRTSGYGGTIYMGDGSNGCVNTPYDAVAKMYPKSYIGMPVIVF